MARRDRQKAILQHSSFALLMVMASACSKAPTVPVAGSALSPSQAAANQEIVSVTAALNQTDQYALTKADLELLESQGLVDSSEKSALALFVKN